MSNDLFIPKKIKVGYQNRKGTYTGRLAYVIYFDNKGVLRKEKSWQSWRDSKIEPEEFENNPQDGFCLNKDVKRYNWSHFGSNRSYIRIYDPRGIEFEVTPENLIGILTETDCLKRGLEGKFVYAWQGTELVLLPCCSEAYKQAQEYTARQDQDISAKDLKPGCSYTTKKGEEVIYLGRFPWYEWKYGYGNIKDVRKSSKVHIFVYPKEPSYGGKFFKKNDVKFLAMLNSQDPVSNYATLIDEWNADVRSSEIKSFESSPANISMEKFFNKEDDPKVSPYIKNGNFIEMSGNTIVFRTVCGHLNYRTQEVKFYIQTTGTLDTSKMTYDSRNDTSTWGYGDYSNPGVSKEAVFAQMSKAVNVDMILSNGKKVRVENIYSIIRS